MKCPQKRAVIVKLKTMTPRKPNSAIRKIAKVRITSTGKKVQAFITGKGHNLQQHSVVMLRGGRANDLPGIHYKMIRGKYDFVAKEDFPRRQKRSRFSLKKFPETRKKAIEQRKKEHSEAKFKITLVAREKKNTDAINYHNRAIKMIGVERYNKLFHKNLIYGV